MAENFKCRYCGKECKNNNSLAQHEIRCKNNPNRIISPFVEYNKNTKVPWNKGLTKETDSRVLKSSETIKELYRSGKLIPGFAGKKHTEESKKKLSRSMKKFLKENPHMVPYLRNHSSKISYPELYFIDVFEKENIRLKHHLQIGLYQLDFYNEDLKKYVEIDGSQHHLPESIIRDNKRTEYLKNLGWEGIRIDWAEYKTLSYDEKLKIIGSIKEFIK